MTDHEVDAPEATRCLEELIDAVLHGGDVVITRRGRPVVRLVRFEDARNAGSAKAFFILPNDPDDPFEEFRDYV